MTTNDTTNGSKTMNRKTFARGSRMVIASRNDEKSRWTACVWVNHGETITSVRATFATDRGLEKWAAKQLAE